MLGVESPDRDGGLRRDATKPEPQGLARAATIRVHEIPRGDDQLAVTATCDQNVRRGVGETLLPESMQQRERHIARLPDAAHGDRAEAAVEGRTPWPVLI